MRYNTRDLLSIPALAIAAMAVSATNVDAQCPGGCFGYPTPSQPAVRAFAPAVTYQPVMQVPTQTFVQTATFVSAPQFAPMESYAPVQSFVQPEQFVQPQFAPVMAAPIEQTFVAQPMIASPIQVIDTPQLFPQQLGTNLPSDTYYPPQQSGVISSGQIIEPMIWNSVGETISPGSGAVDNTEDMPSAIEQEGDQVQEEQIEGEIISPSTESSSSEGSSDSEMKPEKMDEQDSEKPASAKKTSETSILEDNVDEIPLTSAKKTSAQEAADTAADTATDTAAQQLR